MNFLTQKLLNSEELGILRKNLNEEESLWEDGKKTAGKLAAKVKNNLQLKRDSDLSKKFSGLITKKILSNELIKSFALPKKIHGTIFSKLSRGLIILSIFVAKAQNFGYLSEPKPMIEYFILLG